MRNKLTVKAMSISAGSLLLFFMLVASYMFTNGFRDYTKYCSAFIPHIEKIRSQTGAYPDTLNQIQEVKDSLRYKRKECFYSARNGKYELITKHGFMGFAGYQSAEQKWFYD